MLRLGFADEHKNVVFASAKKLPNGEYGLCVLGINKRVLTVCGADFSQEIGRKLYEIRLDQITDLKSSAFVFNRYLQFQYQGATYRFADFGDAKNFLCAVEEGRAVS